MRPLIDSGFRDRLAAVLPTPTELSQRIVLLTFERDTMSHNQDIRRVLSAYDPHQCRVYRAISSSPELFVYTFELTPQELSARNTAILERCQTAQRLRITTAAGTDLEVELDNGRFRWISNRGMWRADKFVVVPAGEVATFAASISGTLCADYAINVNTLMTQDARLDRWPAKVSVQDGILEGVECSNPEVLAFLEKGLNRPNARRVGELGFGTNAAITKAVGMNSHTNERRPGVHLGFGQHNQREEVAGYTCDIHIDLCALGGEVWVDNDPDPIRLADLVPSRNAHPPIYDEEDVTSAEPLDGGLLWLVPNGNNLTGPGVLRHREARRPEGLLSIHRR